MTSPSISLALIPPDAVDEAQKQGAEASQPARHTLLQVEGRPDELVLRFEEEIAIWYSYDEADLAGLLGCTSTWIRQHREDAVVRLQQFAGRAMPIMKGKAGWTLDIKALWYDLDAEAETARQRRKRSCVCGSWVQAGEPVRLHAGLRLVVGCKRCRPGLDAENIKPPSDADVYGRGSELMCWGAPLNDRTDATDASRFVASVKDDLKFVEDSTSKARPWAVWDGSRWERVEAREVKRRLIMFWTEVRDEARAHAASTSDEADGKAWLSFAANAGKRLNRVGLEAVLSLVPSFHGIAITEAAFDGPSTSMLLNVKNGTIDLATGELREHRREDWITFRVELDFDPAATCPRWLQFLGEAQGDDAAMISFLQRIDGYGLTASAREEKAFLFFDGGLGGTGKSTHLNTIHALAGPYARNVEPATFDANGKETIRSDVMRLKAGRFALVNEPDRGMVLSEGMIKKLVSGDPFTGRMRYGDEFEFRSTAKFFMPTNYLPRIQGEDDAIWDRLLVVPFVKRFRGTDGQDKGLKEKLLAELPGILAWAVQGALDWQRRGLDPPPCVLQATASYRERQGGFARWLAACCILDVDETEHSDRSTHWTSTEELYDSYEGWTAKSGVETDAKTDFARKLGAIDALESGRRYVDRRQVRGWNGVRLRSAEGTRAVLL